LRTSLRDGVDRSSTVVVRSRAVDSARGQPHDGDEEVVDGPDRRHELLEVDGLPDVRVGVEVVGGQHVLLRLGGREHNDGDPTEDVVPLHLTKHLAPVASRQKLLPRTTMQDAGGGESQFKKEAREGSKAALAAMLATAERMPDLLAMRRRAWETGLVGRAKV